MRFRCECGHKKREHTDEPVIVLNDYGGVVRVDWPCSKCDCSDFKVRP